MTQYNMVKVILSNSQLNKLKSAMKSGTEVTLNLSSKFIGNFNDETNFAQKLSLTDTPVSKIRRAFANGSSGNIKFWKTQLSKIEKSGGCIPKIPSEPSEPLIISYLKELNNIGAKNK